MSVQNRLSYSKADDAPMARVCAERGIAYLAYQPLYGAKDEELRVPREIARENGVSIYRVMIAWLHEVSPAVLPLVGASRPSSIIDSAKSFALSKEDLSRLSF